MPGLTIQGIQVPYRGSIERDQCCTGWWIPGFPGIVEVLALHSRRMRLWRSMERLMLWDLMLTRTTYAVLVVHLFRTVLAFSHTLQIGVVRFAVTFC